MRKFYFLIIFTSILIATISSNFSYHSSDALNGYTVNYSSDIYEPVDPYPTVNVNGTINIVNGPSKDNLRLKYELFSPLKSGMNKSYSSGYISSKFSYPSSKSFSYTFTIDDKRLNLVREGITVRVGIYDTSARVMLDYIDGHLYPKTSETIDIDDISGELEIDRCLYLSNTRAVEKYNFSNYSHIVEIDKYYELDISSLSFKYTSYIPFSYQEAYLSFNDSHNVFPYIDEDKGMKNIPLKAVDNNGTISFKTQSSYVNKKTLDMSLKQKEGYINTSHFYLPKNKISLLQGLNLFINVKGMGINNISFSYQFEIDINSLLIGPCNESMYCIIGGVEK